MDNKRVLPMTKQEKINTELSASEFVTDNLMPCFYIAALVAMTDTTRRISLSGSDSEKKEQLKKELGRSFQFQ